MIAEGEASRVFHRGKTEEDFPRRMDDCRQGDDPREIDSPKGSGSVPLAESARCSPSVLGGGIVKDIRKCQLVVIKGPSSDDERFDNTSPAEVCHDVAVGLPAARSFQTTPCFYPLRVLLRGFSQEGFRPSHENSRVPQHVYLRARNM